MDKYKLNRWFKLGTLLGVPLLVPALRQQCALDCITADHSVFFLNSIPERYLRDLRGAKPNIAIGLEIITKMLSALYLPEVQKREAIEERQPIRHLINRLDSQIIDHYQLRGTTRECKARLRNIQRLQGELQLLSDQVAEI